jgi:hypothetical protein
VTSVIAAQKNSINNFPMKPRTRFGCFAVLTLPVLVAAVLFLPQVATAGSVSLAWDPNTQPQLAGYQLNYGTTSGQYGTQVDVGNVTTYTVSNLAAGTYYFAVRAYGSSGEQSGLSNEVMAVVAPPPDQTPPVVSNVANTNITASSAMITWDTNEVSDSQVFFGTTPPYGDSPGLNTAMVTNHFQLLSGLLPATMYHYYVVSKDAAGNAASSNTFTFTTAAADTTPPPVPSITSGPANPTNQTGASFSFSDTETGVSFLCQLDTGGFGACSSPETYSGLSEGSHTFSVKAQDAVGNQSGFASYTWSIDTSSPPMPSITSKPSNPASQTSASFSFTDTETGVGFLCQLDTGAFNACSSPQTYSGLSEGSHTFSVKARDAAGNQSGSAGYTWTISTTAPATPSITSSPSNPTNQTNASFSFTDTETGVSFICQLDGSAFSACSNPQNYAGLSDGNHAFSVKAQDTAGLQSEAAGFTWKVDSTPPVISNVRTSNIDGSSATILWTTDEDSDSRIEYGEADSYGSSTSLDAAMVTSHSQNLSGLTSNTTYHYRVVSKDAAGNSAVSDDYTFFTTPTADITTGLVAAYAMDEGSGSITLDSSGNGGTAHIYSADWIPGRYGTAISFDGKKSYLEAAANIIPNLNQPRTVSFWVNVSSRANQGQSFVVLGNAKLQKSERQGYKGSEMGALDSDSAWLVAGGVPAVKSWVHLAYVFDGTMNHLYINGALASTSTLSHISTPVTDFEIGRWLNGTNYFKGGIDEVRVYSRALNPDEVNAAMNTPISAGQAAMRGSSDHRSEESPTTTGSTMLASGSTQPAFGAGIDVQLDSSAYPAGGTVNISAYRISNLSDVSIDVEVKTWLKLPDLLPITLGELGTEEFLNLMPLFSQDYGTMPVLNIANNSPNATGEVDARLLDPVTGAILSADINPFTIQASNGGRAKGNSRSSVLVTPSVVLDSLLVGSGIQYTLANNGNTTAHVEFKVWLESIGGANPIAIFSVGSDGGLVLKVGDTITLNPLASMQIPAGAYIVKSRVMDPTTGEVLIESEKELTIGLLQ